jgi:purine catabolism regulator
MLTLRQALKLPGFEHARVVAGESGLDQVVRHVHTADRLGAAVTWGRGALLLTTGYGLKDSPKLQATLVARLVEQGVVGVVIATGWYFATSPETIKQTAARHGLPIVEMSAETEFITLTERLYIEIVNEQFALEKRSQDIHRQLMQIVLRGGDLAAVAHTLTGILERSVLIESATYQVLAASKYGPIDEARREAMESGRTKDRMLEVLLDRGVYSAIEQHGRPLRLPAIPDIGFTMDRVATSIMVGGDVYGYIWIVAGDRPLAELDELAIDNAATIAALVLLKEQAVLEVQQTLRGDFLLQLLRLDAEPEPSLLLRGQQLGYRFDQPHQVLLILPRIETISSMHDLAGQIERWLCGATSHALVVIRERGLVLVVESRSDLAGQQLAAQLANGTGCFDQMAGVVGVGHLCPPGVSLRTSYSQAAEAADVALRIGRNGAVSAFWELGLLDWLYSLPQEILQRNPYYVSIQQLAIHDQRYHLDLVRTLEAYLECGGSLIAAAATLNVHRNTMVYRLGRIHETIQFDLRDTQQRLNLHVALKGYRLQA